MKNLLLLTLVVASVTLFGCSNNAEPSGASLGGDFTQNDQNGEPVSLSDFRGNIVLVEFWATWCSPCRAHTPFLKELWEKYRSDDFIMIGVSLDFDLDDWRAYISDNNLDWIHVSDGNYFNNAVARQYGINSTPTFMLFDRSGERIGGTWSFRDMEEAIKAALEAE